jgi:hypothetical protein
MRRLLFWLGVLAVVWVAYQFHATHRRDPLDRANLIQIALTFALAAIVQTLWTRDWPMRTVGVLFTAAGTAVVYSYLSFWRDAPEWFVDIGRALYTLGGPLFALGMILWVVDNWRGRQTERRGPNPGRRRDDFLNAGLSYDPERGIER